MFSDLKVLELASVLAGPSVGQFFAELGAEVTKIENPANGGDVTRTWKSAGEKTDDRSAYFCSVNWGKTSIALDLRLDTDRLVVYDLVRQTDIVIASYKPGDDVKLGMDYATLSALNPRLVYGQVTGYGSDNERVGYDAIIQAEAGFMSMNGQTDGPSLKMPVALIDVLAAHHLKQGILLAMLNLARTGKGDRIEVSLLDTAISSLANQATNWLVAGKLPKKHGSSHPNIAPYGDVYLTSDSRELLLAIGSDKQFQELCSLLDLSPLIDDERFSKNASRVENRFALNSILQSAIGQWTAEVLMARIHQARIPAGFIQNLQQVFEMKEAQDLLLSADGITGVRNFIARSNSIDLKKNLTSPPHLQSLKDKI